MLTKARVESHGRGVSVPRACKRVDLPLPDGPQIKPTPPRARATRFNRSTAAPTHAGDGRAPKIAASELDDNETAVVDPGANKPARLEKICGPGGGGVAGIGGTMGGGAVAGMINWTQTIQMKQNVKNSARATRKRITHRLIWL